jgi:hypothetical protein
MNNNKQEIVEYLIVTGLEHFKEDDFMCMTSEGKTKIRVEDGISFCWGQYVKKYISNLFIQFQSRAVNGRVDFYCNGFANCVIEILLNAVNSNAEVPPSQDMNQFYRRFTSGNYAWKNWGILNFAISKPNVIVPTDSNVHHDRVYFCR